MGSCCGRPDNRSQKKGGTPAEYYARYAYLSSHQRAKQAELGASKCTSCDALTMGDPCDICGTKKTQPQPEAKKEG